MPNCGVKKKTTIWGTSLWNPNDMLSNWLTENEAQTIGIYTSRVAKALLDTQGMEHIYTFVIGDAVPHVHVHVIGRYPGAPREYWGPKVDEWPEAPRGKESEIEQVAVHLRAFFSEHYGQSPDVMSGSKS